jgi:phage FluMu protein Com
MNLAAVNLNDYGINNESDDKDEFDLLKEQVLRIMRNYHIEGLMTKVKFKKICRYLNFFAVTEEQATQAIKACRGPWGEFGPKDEYEFDGLIHFMKNNSRSLKAEDPYEAAFTKLRRRNII